MRLKLLLAYLGTGYSGWQIQEKPSPPPTIQGELEAALRVLAGAPVRVLKNKMAREYLALEKRGASLEELEKVTLGGLRRAVLEGDVEMGSVMSGQVAGMLHEIRPVAEIFRDLYESGIARAKATAAEWSDAE